jgi:SAM-dependent methyltransferase
MALHDLVSLKVALTTLVDADPAIDKLVQLRNNIAGIKLHVSGISLQHTEYLDNLVNHYDRVITATRTPMNELEDELAQITSEIDTIALRLFTNNYELEEFYGTVERVRDTRGIFGGPEVDEAVQQRIQLYTNWKYPTLEIGCRDGEWTQHLVAADPLYIMDRHVEFMDITNSKFAPDYQRRLRKYHLANHDLSELPLTQFGFVFSWGYFNYLNLRTIEKYLNQVFAILRPGGTFMFSYNDGDTPAGAGMADNRSQSYVPKSKLTPICEAIGFTVAREFNMVTNVSWIEIKKPGKLKTTKAHQAMGEISQIIP